MKVSKHPETVQVRWKLAKRAQRDRKKAKPNPLSQGFLHAVTEERNRRARTAWRARRKINGVYVEVAGGMGAFVADVWMATICLRAEWGAIGATPTRIARWLWEQGRNGDYAKSSLRPMVYKARKVIAELERCGETDRAPPFWEPFEQSPAERSKRSAQPSEPGSRSS